ncbi:periplasmic heavy metal sensor [Magnetococcus sp. PR-3]|uniref:periplasmic heavy metal sensor n=1 Tax=Magnetococcus sp. PR-3 TaxID=3120355 RepID=UPI002FCE22D8
MKNLPRWLVVILFVSVALNLFFVGMLGISYWRGGPLYRAMHGPTIGGPYMMGHAMRHLDPQTRQQLRPIVQDHMPTMRDSMRQLHQKKRQVHTLLVNDQVDQAALDQAFSELRLHAQQAQESAHRMMMQAATSLPSDIRQQMFKFKGRGHHRKSHRGGGRCDSPDRNFPRSAGQ